MRTFILSILANGASISCAAANARQAEVLGFSDSAIELKSDGRSSYPATVVQKLEEGFRFFASSPRRPDPSPDSVGYVCDGNRYSPTYWLSAETERRRAVFFPIMARIACEVGLPASLLDAVIAQESGYKAWALSGAGAMGMMQVMPGTARILGLRNPWDALANMRAGARYLRQQLDRFGRIDLALAAYNAGPERRSLALGNMPAIPETRNYVQAITTNWVRLTKLGSSNSAVAARAMAADIAVRASGYREVSLITYEGTNAANPI